MSQRKVEMAFILFRSLATTGWKKFMVKAKHYIMDVVTSIIGTIRDSEESSVTKSYFIMFI